MFVMGGVCSNHTFLYYYPQIENDYTMRVANFFINMTKIPSLYIKVIHRIPIEISRVAELPKAAQSNYVLNKIQLPPFC